MGEQLTPLKPDRQLSHIVRFNPKTAVLDFVDAKRFQPSTQNTEIEFQTGPLIVANNKVTTDYIRQSINGLSPFARTLLAYTEEDRKKYFIIAQKIVKLDQLANDLLTLSVFSGKTLHVVNLDGGPSVALHSKTHPELNFNESAVLPIVLGLK